MAVDYKYIVTTSGIWKIIALIFNISSIIFVQSSEYPYYIVKGIIVFDALPIAAIAFTAITFLLLIWNDRLQTCTTWLRIELLILCSLVIVYVYVLIYMTGATVQCYKDAPRDHGCPWQLLATISGVCAIITYCIDAIVRTVQCRKQFQPIDQCCEDEINAGVDNA